MNKKVFKTLEFNKIKGLLGEMVSSPAAKVMVDDLAPFSDINIVNEKLEETSDAALLILKHTSLHFSGFKDLTSIIKRLAVGGNLSASELLNISSLLRLVSKVKSYGNYCQNTLENLSILSHFQDLQTIPSLSKEIDRCILSEEDIADDASSQLYQIRRSIKQTNEKIRQQLNKIITSSTNQTMLQDAIITIKNNRFCVPVKAEHRGNFKGMIHEHSATGSTLFIEPIAVVELNNKLRDLRNDEKKEIERILATLSSLANDYITELGTNQVKLSLLEFIFAKGEFSLRYRCSCPTFNEDKYIHLKKARHPLLDQKTVVPTNIHLGKDFTTLVVTGPNTGGKTVTLKTLGLLSLMGQSGLHIPASDGSSLTMLKEIYADIGDEQSIEQSLSTFSSHMVNIVNILEGASPDSLVLFDELGAGTDPTEGAALAMAILNDLYHKNILTVATTHYSELKVYALSTDGVENACQEFNVETLRPTYKLLIGIPGKSNAFAISKRLGLSDYIIEESKKLLEHKAIRFEDLITDLEVNKRVAEFEKEKAEKYRKEAEIYKANLEEQKDNFERKKHDILKNAKEEAYKVLQDAKKEADTIIRNMNSLSKKGHSQNRELEMNRSKLRNSLTNLEPELSTTFVKAQHVDPASIKKGSRVHVISFDQTGTVLTPPNEKGDLQVQLGIMNTKVHISNIRLINDTPSKTPKSKNIKVTGTGNLNKASNIRPEIDVRGTSSDEAVMLVDKFLDDAYLSHLPQVTIIHGKGTGILRQAIHTKLKRIKYVKSFRIGNYGEGESGVTIVDFK